jgi:hypothetical protein
MIDGFRWERFIKMATTAASPPITRIARITRRRLKTHAIPMPRAAHWNH